MLKNSPLGDVIIELTDIDSTNNYAMHLLNEGMAEHGVVIRADFQTAGKGQLGNLWLADESKNLLMSVILDTSDFKLDQQFYLNAATSLAVAEVLMSNFELRDVCVKWPNDIYAGKKKIAGILIENNIRGTVWTNAILGIGLNVNQVRFPDLNEATSIKKEIHKNVKISQVMRLVLKELDKYLALLVVNPNGVLSSYNKILMDMGKIIFFKRNFELEKGLLKGVNSQGLLEVECGKVTKLFKHKEIQLIIG